MRSAEETRFLDLDMVAEQIRHDGDREMFLEAVSCYQIGSHRAAVILSWSATAACLRRRIDELSSDGDTSAQAAISELTAVEGQAVYEENLIAKSRQCELVDDFEEKCLRFARDTRSKCAHPTGIIPSAEAVRHILYVCSQMVLCRRGYRGTTYIRRLVTTGFDDKHFLPSQERRTQHCDQILSRVPQRLWPLFTKLAAEERPSAATQTWRENSIALFRRVLESLASDGIANEVARGMQGFKDQAPDFFSVLVGIDPRVGRFWDQQQRDSARSRLRATSAARVNAEEVASWANICASDGIDEQDADLLREKLGAVARHLPESFLVSRRGELLKLMAEMSEDDSMSSQAALGLRHLLGTELVEDGGEDLRRIVFQVFKRFRTDDRFRRLLDDVQRWRGAAISQWIELSEDYLLECSEDNPDDVLLLFAAATELAERISPLPSDIFSTAIIAALNGELSTEWANEESEMKDLLQSQSRLLVTRLSGQFEALEVYINGLGEESVDDDDAEEPDQDRPLPVEGLEGGAEEREEEDGSMRGDE